MMAMRPPPPRPRPMPPPMMDAGGFDARFWAVLAGALAVSLALGIPLRAAMNARADQERDRFMSACIQANHTEPECRFMFLRDARAERESNDKALSGFLFGLALGSASR